MPAPRSRQLLTIGAAVAIAITLIACGSNNNPSADPGPSGTDVLVDDTATPGTEATGEISQPSSSPPSSAGNTNQPPPNPYPGNAKDYGLKFLAAIKSNDQTKIVDFAGVNVYQDAIGNYNAQNLNGNWSSSHCEGGSCWYYNEVGNTAQVGIDSSKLGKAHAVGYVNFDVGTFENDINSYVMSFLFGWLNGQKVTMNSHALDGVVNGVGGLTKPTGGFLTAPVGCGSGKQCVDAGHELAGGQPYGPCIRFVVQTSKLGKADAIVEAKADDDCNP